MSPKNWRLLFVFLAPAVGLLLLPSAARAATFTVTTTADTDDGVCNANCSLREAIFAANHTAGDDTITFAPNVTGVITLTSFPPNLTSNLNDSGASTGSVSNSSGSGSATVTVNLTSASNAQRGSQ